MSEKLLTKITTEQLFNEYFETLPIQRAYKNKAAAKLPKLIEYELKIGKPFIEMTAKDFVNFFTEIKLTHTERMTITHYRRAFDHYIMNYNQDANNPLNHPLVKNFKLFSNECITQEKVDNIFRTIKEKYDGLEAEYMECIIRFLLSGVRRVSDIIKIKQSDVDFSNHTITLDEGDRVISMPERLEFLIKECSQLVDENTWRNSVYVRWHESVLPISVKKEFAEDIDERDYANINKTLNKKISFLKEETGNINLQRLCYYGFYVYLIEKYDKDYIDSNLQQISALGFNGIIAKEAYDYGLFGRNSNTYNGHIKDILSKTVFG